MRLRTNCRFPKIRSLQSLACSVRAVTIVIIVNVLIGLSSTTAYAQSKEKIHWLVWDLPPEFVKAGPWKNQGYADKFLKFFMENLPDYDHDIRHVNIPRWSLEVLKPNRCSAHLWSGFFPDQLLLSKPYSFTPPHVAIFHKRLQSRIGPEGTVVSLEKLLGEPDLTLLIMRLNFNEDAVQSRYPILHPYIAPYIGEPNVMEFSSLENVANLRLLELDRADYTIGYPSTITTQIRVKNLGDDYIAYPIKEHNYYKKVHAACKNDSFGRGVIEKINALLTDDVLLKFLSYHEEWNNKDPNFRRTTIDYFINGKMLDNVID